MKRIFSLLFLMLIITLGLFGQVSADSTSASTISNTFGVNTSVILTILGIVWYVIGTFFVKGKWYAITHWAEKIALVVYTFLHWLNNKTNNGQEINEKSPKFSDVLK